MKAFFVWAIGPVFLLLGVFIGIHSNPLPPASPPPNRWVFSVHQKMLGTDGMWVLKMDQQNGDVWWAAVYDNGADRPFGEKSWRKFDPKKPDPAVDIPPPKK